MGEFTTVQLRPLQVTLDSAEFHAISGWPYRDTYIARLLRQDIPQRIHFNACRVWVYRDTHGNLAGFGTLDVCDDYSGLLDTDSHLYIPLLAVNPTMEGRGFGTAIVRHLTDEAALLAASRNTARWQDSAPEAVLLDAYSSNVRAISLYAKCGFVQIGQEEIDTGENDRTYVIMQKRIDIAVV